MGLFQQNSNTLRSSAVLDLTASIYEGDKIACQITPLDDNGEYAKSKRSPAVTVDVGEERIEHKDPNEDAWKLRMIYYLVTFIGMFIPLSHTI